MSSQSMTHTEVKPIAAEGTRFSEKSLEQRSIGTVGTSLDSLTERLNSIAGGYTYAYIAEKTLTNPATARRYMLGHPPSTQFLILFMIWRRVSPDYLLTGQGPPMMSDYPGYVLRSCSTQAIMHELGRRFDAVDKMITSECYIQHRWL